MLAKHVTEKWGSHGELIALAKELESLGLEESTSDKKSSLSVRARYPSFDIDGQLRDLPDQVFSYYEAEDATSLAFRILVIGDFLLQREEFRIEVEKQNINDLYNSLLLLLPHDHKINVQI